MRDHLERFAQAHVVGQDAATAQVFKRAEPLVSVDLVAAHRCLERCRHRKVLRAERVQALDGAAERGVAIGLKRRRACEHAIDKKGARRGDRHAVEQVDGIDAQIFGKAKRSARSLIQAHDVAGRQARKRLVALVRVQIDGKICRRKPARAQLDIEQIALDGRTNRELGRGAHRNLAQTVAEHDLTQLGQGGQALGQQVEQALIIALLKRQAALLEIEVHGSRVHNAKLRHHVAGRHAGALLFKGTARSAQAKEIRRPIAVGNRNFAGHEPIADTDRHSKARLGCHGIERGGRGEVGVVAQNGQRHTAELTHLLGGNMGGRAARQQARQKRCGMLSKCSVGTARAARVNQVGGIARRKAVHIGGQAQVIATTSRRRDFGGKQRWALSGCLVLPLRRQLNRHVVGAMRRHPPRPGGLKGDGLAAQQVQHIYDAMLGQRQLTLGNKTAAGKVVRRRTRACDVIEIGNCRHNKVEQLCRCFVKGLR